MNELEKAAEHYGQFHDIAEALFAADPHSDKAKGNLAVALSRMAGMNLRRGNRTAAREHASRALELGRQMADDPQSGEVDPTDVLRNLATFSGLLGTVLLPMDPADSRDYFIKAKGIRERLVEQDPDNLTDRKWLGETYVSLGNVSFALGDFDEMRNYYVQCMKLREALVQAKPETISYKRDLADSCGRFGEKCLQVGATKEALEFYQMSLKEFRGLVQRFPDTEQLQSSLAYAYYGTATAQFRLGELEAAENYRECLKIQQALWEKHPNERDRQIELMLVLARCGDHTRAAEMAGALQQRDADKPGSLYQVACCYALCSWAVKDGELESPYADKAVAALGQACTLGYKNLAHLKTDPDLDPIRDHTGYKQLIEKLGSR